MTKREKIQYILVLLADLAAVGCSALICLLVFGWGLHLVLDIYTAADQFWFFALLFLSFLAAFLCFDQNEDIVRRSAGAEFFLCLRFNGILLAVYAVLLLVTKTRMLESRYLVIGIPLVNLFLMMLAHSALKNYLRRPDSIRAQQTLVGILTTRARAPALIADLRSDWTKTVHGLALYGADAQEIGQQLDGVPVKANDSSFLDWVRGDALDEVYIDLPDQNSELLTASLRELESMGLTVRLKVPFLARLEDEAHDKRYPSRLSPMIEECAGAPMVTLCATKIDMNGRIIKRVMDILGGLVGGLLSIPIIAVVAIPLKLESPGPLIFKQKRVGLNGRVFEIHKLRSMHLDAEARKRDLLAQNEMNGLMFKIADDPRITRVGRFIRKTSIDELPQFFDVLMGNMSLVGTRPPTLDEYDLYESHHKRRLSMKPGITGLWQVSGRSKIENFEDVVRMDVDYIDNWSPWLDIKILLKTFAVVFTARGAE